MKTKMNKLALVAAIAALSFNAQAVDYNSESATVSMNVGLFASLTGLDDFSLDTITSGDTSGEAGAVYNGNTDFNVESNGQVHVSMTGGDLTNGSDSVSTTYSLDSGSTEFDTPIGVVHNASHNVSAEAVLGAIAAQKSGAYSGQITITVSSI